MSWNDDTLTGDFRYVFDSRDIARWREDGYIGDAYDAVWHGATYYLRVVWTDAYGVSASDECLINSNEAAVIAEFKWHELLGNVHQRGILPGYGIDVPVYRNGDSRNGFSREFMLGYVLRKRLEDYPVLDESDFCEREYAAWQDAMETELRYLAHDDDSEDDITAINSAFYDAYYDCGWHSFSPDDIGQDVEEHYENARNAYFEARALDHFNAQIDGQGNFDV